MSTPVQITISQGGSSEVLVCSDRSVRIITYLLRRQTEIDAMKKGRIEFNFAGSSIVPSLLRLDDPL
jgi:hypothetical protein